jgi:hypothetical protein
MRATAIAVEELSLAFAIQGLSTRTRICLPVCTPYRLSSQSSPVSLLHFSLLRRNCVVRHTISAVAPGSSSPVGRRKSALPCRDFERNKGESQVILE